MTTRPSESAQAPDRALSFGSVAESYERYRLGYPDDVVDTVLRYAGRPVRTALEVGAGTGKATVPFASRGIAVTAVEPDPDMAAVLRGRTGGLPVEPVVITFERFSTSHRFDLLLAAASWHWTDPATRWARTVELLVPGGVIALVGRVGELSDPDLAAAVDEIERHALPGGDGGSAGVHPWSLEETAEVEGLTDQMQVELPAPLTTTADEYVGHLATVSAYILLDPRVRASTLQSIRAALPDEVGIDGIVQLAMARRV